MKNEKAFTLIELLAVIIILAAIALIIAPLVLDIIKEQKMKTFKESINGVLRSSRLELVNSGLSFPATFTYSNGKLSSPTGKELKVTGKIPGGSGTVTFKSEEDIELAIHDNDWCGTYNRTNKEVEVNEYDGECEIIKEYNLTSNDPMYDCFTFDANTGTLTDYTCEYDSIVIPTKIDGVNVLRIENNFNNAYIGGGYKLKSVDFSKAYYLTEIGERAFEENVLTSVEIPSSVTSIGNRAFILNQLTSVTLGNSVTSIGVYAFSYNQLMSVKIPNGVTSIGKYAFQSNQLTSVTLGNSVTSIGFASFGSNQLTSVIIPDSVTSIGGWAFEDNQLTSVTIPSSVTSIESGAFNNNQLSDDQAFIYARNSDGSIDNTTIVSYGGAKRSNVIIPSNVTSIGKYAFYNNQLTSVTIPSSVMNIGSSAFWNNKLTSVTIKGKSSSSDFTTYGTSIWGWADGYSDSNIIWNG